LNNRTAVLMSERNPQIGVRFDPDEYRKVLAFVERHFAGDKSTAFRVAIRRLMDRPEYRDEAA
jgi:hypothetical protein